MTAATQIRRSQNLLSQILLSMKRLGLLMAFATAGCGIASAPIKNAPQIVATPQQGQLNVTTQPGASVTLGFGDGSSVALGGNTSIAIEDAAPVNGQPVPSRVTLLSGDIHAIVPDKTTGQPHSLEVDSENTKATGPSPNQ